MLGWGDCAQREGMGLLEYQAIPSLRDIAHDGWLCIFTGSWKGSVWKRQAVRPSITYKITPASLIVLQVLKNVEETK
jgi:hypothetical protein